MREHFGLLPVLTSSSTVGGQSCAGSGPFQATASGHWSSQPRLLAGLRCKHCRARQCPAPRWQAALITLQLHGSAPPACCLTGRWHLYDVEVGLPKIMSEAGCVWHCWALPVGSLVVCWEEGSGGGTGQKEELFSQNLFGLPLAVLWDDTVRGREAWCLSAFSSDPVFEGLHFQSALMPVRVFYVTHGFTFQSFAVFFCFLFKLSGHTWIYHPLKCLRPKSMWNRI